MGLRLFLIMCLVIAVITALPSNSERNKRDATDTMKNAWDEVVKTITDAGDAVVQVFKPTEKSVLDKMADGVKGLAD